MTLPRRHCGFVGCPQYRGKKFYCPGQVIIFWPFLVTSVALTVWVSVLIPRQLQRDAADFQNDLKPCLPPR
jgi:hypothetical protein